MVENKTNILYITSACSPKKYRELNKLLKDNATQKFNNLIIEGLNNLQCNIDVISLLMIPKKLSSEIYYKKDIEEYNGIKYLHLSVINQKILKYINFTLQIITEIIKWKNRNKNKELFVICDVMLTGVNNAIVFICKLLNIKILGIVADINPLISKDLVANNKKVQSIMSWIYRYNLKNYNRLYFNNRTNE